MKDNSITMTKGFLLLLLVISECTSIPEVKSFLATFTLPALFIAIGSEYDNDLLQNKMKFLKSCIQRIYIPFICFSLFFLLVHNVLSVIGVVSTDVAYSWTQMNQNIWSIVWNMSGYDDIMCSLYWIFRVLVLGSISYLVIYTLCKKLPYFKDEIEVRWAVLTICAVLLLWKVASSVNVTGVADGGYRELITLFFIACGALYNIYKPSTQINWIWALVLLVVVATSAVLLPTQIEPQGNILDVLKLILPATTAFLIIDTLFSRLNNQNLVQTSLTYVGSRYVYVIAFLILGLKMASMLTITFSDVTWSELAMTNVVRVGEGFSVLDLIYIIFGLGLPSLIYFIIKKLDARYHMDFAKIVEFIVSLLKYILVTLFKFMIMLFHFVVDVAKGIASVIKDFWKASNPKDD